MGGMAAIYAVAGFATLALETLWIRECLLRTGGTVVAAALVIGVFFLGAALGNLVGAKFASANKKPLRAFAILELASALSTLLLFFSSRALWTLIPGANIHSVPAVFAIFIMVGLPAALSGAAFPMLSQHVVREPGDRIPSGAALYGANLFGAAFGVLAGGIVFPWYLGMRGAFVSAVLVQVAAALVAWRLSFKVTKPLSEEIAPAPGNLLLIRLGQLLFVVCGFLSLAAQGTLISWVRQVHQGSIYAISGVLSAFILGLGLGALLVSLLTRKGCATKALFPVFSLLAAMILLITPSPGAWLVEHATPLQGNGPIEMLLHSTFWSIVFIGPLTICIGAIFPLTWEMAKGVSHRQGSTLGRIVAWNKIGSALGMFAGAFLLLPLFGVSLTTYFLGWAYLFLVVFFCLLNRDFAFRVSIPTILITFFGIYQWFHIPGAMGLTSIDREVATYQGAYGPVSVIENKETGSRSLLLNSKQRLNGTARALSSQHHQGWLPLLFAKDAKRVVSIGMASGISTAAILDFPVEKVFAIELVPEVARAARDHFAPWSGAVFTDPRVEVVLADGRAALPTLEGPLDVVLCDLLFPEEDGAANLYSKDFMEKVRKNLSDDGLFCLWLPCYQLDEETIGIILHTFAEMFPNAIVIRSNFDPLQPVIGLLGSPAPIRLNRTFLEQKLATPSAQKIAQQSPFFSSPDHAWFAIVGDLHSAKPGFSQWLFTTDDRPMIAFLGPRDLGNRRLIGMAFAKWLTGNFGSKDFPSAQMADTLPAEIHASSLAAQAFFIASVADSVIEGDTRPDAVRLRQTIRWLERSKQENPRAIFSNDAMGR